MVLSLDTCGFLGIILYPPRTTFKNILDSLSCGERSRKSVGGIPRISHIRVIWSCSLVPGKRGSPVRSSTMMQPRDHMSIAGVYVWPSMTSGER